MADALPEICFSQTQIPGLSTGLSKQLLMACATWDIKLHYPIFTFNGQLQKRLFQTSHYAKLFSVHNHIHTRFASHSIFFIFTTFVCFLLVFLNMVAALGFGDTPLSAFHPILGAPQFLIKDSLKLSLIPCSSPFTSNYGVILLAHLILCTISCKLMFWIFLLLFFSA